MPKFFATLSIALGFLFFQVNSFAQDSEFGLTKLTADQEKSYREIIGKPIDEGLLNLKKIDAYREKEHAFHMLGEFKGREEKIGRAHV